VAEVVSRAAAPRRLRLQVAPEEAERAAAVLAGVPAVTRVEPAERESGWLTIELGSEGSGNGGPSSNAPIGALLDAAIALRSLEVDGARLSDAFLAIIEAS
jgi:ABC-2 type transport system ATP-binding protein